MLLLALGVIEWQRAKGVLKAAWSGWVFPVLAIGGSSLLLFHQHEGGMHGANHMELMARIQSEHLSYAVTGIGIGLTKGLAEVKTRFQERFRKNLAGADDRSRRIADVLSGITDVVATTFHRRVRSLKIARTYCRPTMTFREHTTESMIPWVESIRFAVKSLAAEKLKASLPHWRL